MKNKPALTGVGSMPLLPLPDNALKEIVENATDIANRLYPDLPRFFFERRRIRNEHIGAEIMVRISSEG